MYHPRPRVGDNGLWVSLVTENTLTTENNMSLKHILAIISPIVEFSTPPTESSQALRHTTTRVHLCMCWCGCTVGHCDTICGRWGDDGPVGMVGMTTAAVGGKGCEGGDGGDEGCIG